MPRQRLIPPVGNADLRLLRIFKAVAACGGLAAAETELNIGRSAISRHLSDLEGRLGMVLCHRGPAGFALTEEGRQVLGAVGRLLAAVGDFRTEVSELRERLGGVLRVALFDHCITNPAARISETLGRFNEAAPDVQVELSLLAPNLVEAGLLAGTLDIGMIAMHRTPPGLDLLPVHGETMFLFCGRGHPFFDRPDAGLDLPAIRAAAYAGISFNSPNLAFGQTLDMRPKAVVQNETMLAALILSGRFVGFLPDHMAAGLEAQGLMRRLLPDAITYATTFAAATRRTPAPNRITRVFRRMLEEAHAPSP